jgi:predicted dehydrogenase
MEVDVVSTGPQLRVGVLGCGYWGSKHVRVLSAIDSVGEVAAIDSRIDRLLSLRRSFPSVRTYPDLETALPHVDAVVIATPPSTHAPLALEAIAAGRHVLIEKPLATSATDARRIIAAAKSAGVVLMVGHTFEHNAAVWKLRELVRSQALGELYYLDTARLNLGLYQTDVNVIFDLAPHDVSILNYVLGGPPLSVQAWASRHAHRRLEDVAYLRLRYESGVSANVHVSWLDPCKVRRVTVVGSRQMAVYNDLRGDERLRVYDKGVFAPEHLGDITQPPMSYRYGDVVSPYIAPDEPLTVQDEHFVECIATNVRPLTDGANGLAVVEVLEAAQLSLVEQREVFINEGPSRLDGNHPNGSGPHSAVNTLASSS